MEPENTNTPAPEKNSGGSLGMWWTVLILIIIIVVGFFLFRSPSTTPIEDADIPVPSEEGENVEDAEAVNGDVEAETVVITYTDAGFSPQEATVSAGDTVRFVDESAANDMWVATAQHPTHTVYPGSDINKCDTAEEEGIFDQCRVGESYEFLFDEVGEWAYHNHMQANHFGRVIVE